MALTEPREQPRLVDLGCGDGRLTVELSRRLGASETLGVDSSPSMLEAAAARSAPTVEFIRADISTWSRPGRYDLLLSNAALQWVPDHEKVLRLWAESLSPGGQIAVQMPANADHPSHVVSQRLAEEWLGAQAPPDPVAAHVVAPERYAEMLHRIGFQAQTVRLQVYGHLLASSADVVEWVKGTSLTRFRSVLDDESFERFVAEYRRRLLGRLGDRAPYFYAFKRILLWARR